MLIVQRIFIVLCLGMTNFAYSQVSQITHLPKGMFSLSTEGKLTTILERLRTDTGNKKHLLLVTMFGPGKNIDVTYIKIDSISGAEMLILHNDSVTVSQRLSETELKSIGNYHFIDDNNLIDGVFRATANSMSSEKMQIMLFVNESTNKWVEVHSIDADLGFVLQNEKEFPDLRQIYGLIEQLSSIKKR